MEFLEFRNKLYAHINEITKDVTRLFAVEVDKDELWNVYLDSFPEAANPIFRERRVYDCSECRQFIRSFGNVVVLKDLTMISIWDFELDDPTFGPVVKAMSKYIHSHRIAGLFTPRGRHFGVKENRELLPSNFVKVWNHLYWDLPKHIKWYRYGQDANAERGELEASRQVFARSLKEITFEAIDTVLEMINENTLYRGEGWKEPLTGLRQFKEEFEQIPDVEVARDEVNTPRAIYLWDKPSELGTAVSRIRNHSIGTLLIDLSEGVDIETAVKKYEKIVAPECYQRSKPIFTKRMREDAKKKVEELGYTTSLQRRFARIDDITVNNVLYSDIDVKPALTDTDDPFSVLESQEVTTPKQFNHATEISIGTFIDEILPEATHIEALVEGRLRKNFVSLITSKDENAPSMFKWNNPFSWAYIGNIADSSIKENVKMSGGKVDGELRFSIQWNDGDRWDKNDLDAHCIEPNGFEIYYLCSQSARTGGELDIDITSPKQGVPAVENITWPDRKRMVPGVYRFFVENFDYRGGDGGFRAEIEFDGEVHQFEYLRKVLNKERIPVASVEFDGNSFNIIPMLKSTMSTTEIWGVHTNQFVPVSHIMYSPNYWDGQKGVGNRHYFFMLQGCVNKDKPNGFFNEYLKEELREYRRVFEALGNVAHVVDTPDQLSGIGFSSTRRETLIMKVNEKVYKVKI